MNMAKSIHAILPNHHEGGLILFRGGARSWVLQQNHYGGSDMRVSKGRSKYAFTITIENRAEAVALWHRFSVGPHQPLMRYLKWADTTGEYDEEVFAEMWRIFNGSFPLRKIEREEAYWRGQAVAPRSDTEGLLPSTG
jgi:hypothetical protein